ncbi:hypothetical protein Tco_0844824 [Tanacetum coccineum]
MYRVHREDYHWDRTRQEKLFEAFVLLAYNLRDARNLSILAMHLKSRFYGPFAVSKDMKNGAIELCDEEGNKFIVNKQCVKPYQKDMSGFDTDDDIILDDEGRVTKFFQENKCEIFTVSGDSVRIFPDGVKSPDLKPRSHLAQSSYLYRFRSVKTLIVSLYIIIPPNFTLAFRKLLEDIHVTWTHLGKKRDKIAALQRSGFKNCSQSLETASQFLATLSEPLRDGVKKSVTASERNSLKKP